MQLWARRWGLGGPLLAATVGCAGARPAAPAARATLVVAAFSLRDTSQALGAVSVSVWRPGSRLWQRRPLAERPWGPGSTAVLPGLPAAPVVVHVASVGWDAQRVALTLLAGCPDTLAVFLPPSPTSLFGTEPQAGRWAVRGCARGG